jgi:hypothetical protein
MGLIPLHSSPSSVGARSAGRAALGLRRWARRAAAAIPLLALATPAGAITCASAPTDGRFDAVCGLAPRARENTLPWSEWYPEGSGVLIQWTDPQQNTRVGILTVRHFIDHNGTPNGSCTIQTDLWYAYFRGCPEPPGPPPQHICPCTLDETTRVRVTCFTLPDGEFYSSPGTDGLVIGEIHPEDLGCLSHITPFTIASPVELTLCAEAHVHIAGWGQRLYAECCLCSPEPARTLAVGTTRIKAIDCKHSAREATIWFDSFCSNNSGCLASGLPHDSGGALLVEMPDLSFRLVGVIRTSTSALMAVQHHLITPPSAQHLCTPCWPITKCGDVNNDGRVDCDDLDLLLCLRAQDLAPWPVGPWCPGDLDGDGLAGHIPDLKETKCDRADPDVFGVCVPYFCPGDVNRDGWVNSDDFDLIWEYLDGVGSRPCPCHSCFAQYESCPWDVNFDGVVDGNDLLLASGSHQCSVHSSGCGVPILQCPDEECPLCPQ